MRPFLIAIGFLITSVFTYGEDEINQKPFSLGRSYGRESKSVNLFAYRTAFWITSGEKDVADYKITEKLPRYRNVLDLYTMLECVKNPCPPMNYLDYGCYCGLTLTDSGFTVDGIDTCCLHHDQCYDKSACNFYTEYWFPYLWQCLYDTEPHCDSDQGVLALLFGNESCNKKICECDRMLTKCLQKYPCPAILAECKRPL